MHLLKKLSLRHKDDECLSFPWRSCESLQKSDDVMIPLKSAPGGSVKETLGVRIPGGH